VKIAKSKTLENSTFDLENIAYNSCHNNNSNYNSANKATIEKKYTYDKGFEDLYFKATPVTEKDKYIYDKDSTRNDTVGANRRISHIVYTTGGTGEYRYHADSGSTQCNTNDYYSNGSEYAPKRHVTYSSVQIPKVSIDASHSDKIIKEVIESDSKLRPYMSKYEMKVLQK
jgi:hypothetical protein